MCLQVAPTHDRLASELLAVLVAAGFLSTDAAGVFTATPGVDSPATSAVLQQLPATAERLAADIVPQLRSNILLIWACMEALPRILTGGSGVMNQSHCGAAYPTARSENSLPVLPSMHRGTHQVDLAVKLVSGCCTRPVPCGDCVNNMRKRSI